MTWRDTVRALWPSAPAEHVLNPPAVFAVYERVLDETRRRPRGADDPKFLDLSQQLFERETARRTSTEGRAALLMPATALAATLISSIGFPTIKEFSATPTVTRGMILIVYAIVLIYLARTTYHTILCLYGPARRYTVGPDDIVPPTMTSTISPYHRSLALKSLGYTIQNYKVNNRQWAQLQLAVQCFRNAVFVIIFGAIAIAIESAVAGAWALWSGQPSAPYVSRGMG
jgi:hypothetical protein